MAAYGGGTHGTGGRYCSLTGVDGVLYYVQESGCLKGRW